MEITERKTSVAGKTVLVFGGTGSLGRAIIKRCAKQADLHVFSRDEAKHWTLKNELGHSTNVTFHVGDVRDKDRVLDVITQVNPSVIISAAALKHVDTCELSPTESLETNVRGPRNIIDACRAVLRGPSSLSCVLQVSTDKACEPVNVYGMCKAVTERLFTSQPYYKKLAPMDRPCMPRRDPRTLFDGTPRFVTVRYGNVLESRGSIVPLFRWQAEHAQALTVTDPDMTRFAMTLDDSVDLILLAIERADNGETWIPRLPSMRIGDLATLFSELYSKRIVQIPVRPGEKRHETLVGKTEAVRTLQVCGSEPGERTTHYIINPSQAPAGRSSLFSPTTLEQYTSADEVMTLAELKTHLTSLNMLTADLSAFTGSKIEEIRTL